MPNRIVAKALERGVQTAEIEALRAVGEPEVLFECLASGGVLALIAHQSLSRFSLANSSKGELLPGMYSRVRSLWGALMYSRSVAA